MKKPLLIVAAFLVGLGMEYTGMALVFTCQEGNLLIKPHKYRYPNADNVHDKSWVDATVRIEVDRFTGSYPIIITDVEFAMLSRELKYCYADLKKEFDFSLMDGGLSMKVVGDGLGHFCLRGECEQYNSALKFEMTFDQTHIPRIINELEEISKRYPYDKSYFKI